MRGKGTAVMCYPGILCQIYGGPKRIGEVGDMCSDPGADLTVSLGARQ